MAWRWPLSQRLPRANRLAVGHLDPGEDAQIARSVLETSALPEDLAETITAKAEGNPLYIEEVTKALVESGALRRSGDGYELARAVSAAAVPDTLQGVILSRIDRLAAEEKEALQLASVIGREFTVRLLDRIADLRGELDDVLGELKSLELVYETAYFPELAYMFKHALTHEVAYSTLLGERRKALHRVVASAVEEVYADRLAEQYETLAYHYLEGEAWEQALDYLDLSGDKAAAAFASREAVAFYGQALEICDRLDDPGVRRSVAVARKRGWLSMGLGNLDDAFAEVDRVVEAGRVLGDGHVEGMGLALRGQALLAAHRYDEAEEAAAAALTIGRSGDDEVRAFAAGVLGLVRIVTGWHNEAGPILEEQDRYADAIEDPELRAMATVLPKMVSHWEGRTDVEATLDAHADRLYRGPTQRLMTSWIRGLQRGLRGEYEGALDVLHDGLEASHEAGFAGFEMRMLNTIGWVHGEIQDHEEALDWNRRSLELARATELPDYEVEGNARVNLGDTLMALGRLEEAEAEFRRVEAVYRDPAPPDLWMLWRCGQHLLHSYGELKLLRDDPEGALAYADECLELAERTSSLKNVIKARRLRGQGLTTLGRVDEADGELLAVLDDARGLGNPPQLWRTHAALGELRLAQGREDDADAAFADAWSVVEGVAESLVDPGLRETFLGSSEVRRIRDRAGV